MPPTNLELKEEFKNFLAEKCFDLQKYKTGDYDDIIADWWLKHLSEAEERGYQAAVEEVGKEVYGMGFVQPEQAGQFALHSDGYNQAIDEVMDYLKSLKGNEK